MAAAGRSLGSGGSLLTNGFANLPGLEVELQLPLLCPARLSRLQGGRHGGGNSDSPLLGLQCGLTSHKSTWAYCLLPLHIPSCVLWGLQMVSPKRALQGQLSQQGVAGVQAFAPLGSSRSTTAFLKQNVREFKVLKTTVL